MFSKMSRKVGMGLSLAGVSMGLSGCTHGDYPKTNPADTTTVEARARAVREIGQGIFLFPASNFPFALKEFRESHPMLAIVGVTQGIDRNQGEGNASWGGADTFVVVTEPREDRSIKSPSQK